MAIQKEQVVFIGTALLLGWFVWSDLSDSGERRRRRRSGPSAQFVEHLAPDTSVALPAEREGDIDRDVFTPPRDTQPLPPLSLAPPPLPELEAIAPPALPGPAPDQYGKLLRRPIEVQSVDGLFALVDEESLEIEDGFGFNSLGGAGDEDADEPDAPDPRGSLDPVTDPDLMSAEDLAAQIEGYKKLYDWIKEGRIKWGRIHGDDRYFLSSRPDSSIHFVEVDPRTGSPRYGGQGPIEYTRDRIQEFGFADTVANAIELGYIEFLDGISPSEYERALEFAEFCIEHRLESPRALEIAEDVFRRCLEVSNEDITPRLGLARVFEARFDFEAAFRSYGEMIDEGLDGSNPVLRARLGALLARFRLFDRAEEEMRAAARFGRTQWEVQWTLGRFLYDRGRAAEGLAHLESAERYLSTEPPIVRARVRADLGAALLAVGRIEEAGGWFERALDAEETLDRARAGAVVVELLASDPGGNGNGAVPAGSAVSEAQAEEESAGFELTLARGLQAMEEGRYEDARDLLETAAEADPLRAYAAWRALSHLAERTGYPEEALRYVEQAFENDPTDPYTLFQRGRLYVQRDDVEGAMESFRGALDRELDLADALAYMGESSYRIGEYAAAERYFERALLIDEGMAQVHALRALNYLELNEVQNAVLSAETSLGLDRANATAQIALAWSFYFRRDPQEAIRRFADLDDLLRRRGADEEAPLRAYAREQMERIQDHEQKVLWTDRFNRRDLANSWLEQEGAGPKASLREGRVVLEGDFKRPGKSRLYRERPASQFVALQGTITIQPGTQARVGIAVSRERYRRGEDMVQSEVAVSRHKDGAVQVLFQKREADEALYNDVEGAAEWPTGRAVPVRIERSGEDRDTRITMLVDGLPVAQDVPFPSLGSANAMLRLAIFVEGETGRSVEVEIDDIEIIFREE